MLDALAVKTEGPRQSGELPDHIRFSESVKDIWFVSNYMRDARSEAVHQIPAPEETVACTYAIYTSLRRDRHEMTDEIFEHDGRTDDR